MPVNFFSGDTSYSLRNRRKLRDWIVGVIVKSGFTPVDLNFIFCSDPFLLQLNRDHLQHDYYTDVITFDYSEGKNIRGEIYISIDRIRENALDIDTPMTDELHRVMIHGVLHLLGEKDKTPAQKKKMTQLEDRALSQLK